MKKIKKAIKNVGQSLGLIPTNKQLEAAKPVIPPVEFPNPPAPVASAARTTAGAEVVVGSSAATKDGRVSGRRAGSARGSGGNVLGGLGRGGLSI